MMMMDGRAHARGTDVDHDDGDGGGGAGERLRRAVSICVYRICVYEMQW